MTTKVAVSSAVCCFSSGCVSFRAIETTAQLAVSLEDHTHSLAYGGKICTAILASQTKIRAPQSSVRGVTEQLSNGKNGTCGQFAAATEGWIQVVDALVLYGQSLAALSGRKTIDLRPRALGLTAAIGIFGLKEAKTPRVQSSVTAASALVGLIVDEVRRGKLTSHIERANPHVQTIKDGLVGHMDSELHLLSALSLELESWAADYVELPEGDLMECSPEEQLIESPTAESVGTAGPGSTPSEASQASSRATQEGAEVLCDSPMLRDSIALLLLAQQGWILERRRDLIEAKTEVKAFAEAHQILTSHATSLGTEDAAHLVQIAARLKDVYTEGARALKDESTRIEPTK